MTPEVQAAADKAAAEKAKGEMPQWAKDLEAKVDKLSGGGGAPNSSTQVIPPTTPPKTPEQIKAESETSKSGEKKKGFLDWLL